MELKFVDPRALKENPDRARRTKSTPQADALLLATIKAVGIVQPPVVVAEADGGNGFVIDAGHRRVKQAIAAGLEQILVLVDDRAEDGGAMRSLAETLAHEQLNPVDQWRAIERLVALGWTEEAIAVALALPVRQIKKLRLLANVLPAMLDHMAKGDMPDERQLRTIASGSLEDQKEVWKAHKPTKGDPQVDWWRIAQGLTRTRMYAKHASFGDDLREAYGIVWIEDLFAPADEDSRYTTDTEAFLGAQQEWMTRNLPKHGTIAEVGSYGDVKLPPKAERVYGKPGKSDHTAMYLDREGRVQTVAYRLPEPKKAKGIGGVGKVDDDTVAEAPRQRPDVTRRGVEMIGDFRTDALHEALANAPIEDDTLLALFVLALAGRNITIASGTSDDVYGFARMERHAARLIGAKGKLAYEHETLQQVARLALIEVLSCRENRSDSGIVARVAGAAIGADGFLPNMGTDDFLSCLSRSALEGATRNTAVLPRARVKDTRAALVQHFSGHRFVYPTARFAPTAKEVLAWIKSYRDEDEPETEAEAPPNEDGIGEGSGAAPVTTDHTKAEAPESWPAAAE
jgi:ParB/RepB/Spo0J family partition protein